MSTEFDNIAKDVEGVVDYLNDVANTIINDEGKHKELSEMVSKHQITQTGHSKLIKELEAKQSDLVRMVNVSVAAGNTMKDLIKKQQDIIKNLEKHVQDLVGRENERKRKEEEKRRNAFSGVSFPSTAHKC